MTPRAKEAILEARRRAVGVPPCGRQGCGIAAAHGRCAVTTVHVHGNRAGCSVAGVHSH